jgi:anti-sigma B factor antagonist
MNFETTHFPNYTLVISLVDKLDATNSSELKSEFVSINKSGVNTIIFDLSKSKYCDSSGLSAILVGNRICKDTNGKFALVGLQANVLKMIQISQLDKVITIKEFVQDAAEFLEKA